LASRFFAPAPRARVVDLLCIDSEEREECRFREHDRNRENESIAELVAHQRDENCREDVAGRIERLIPSELAVEHF
jgi:hypothetical protein